MCVCSVRRGLLSLNNSFRISCFYWVKRYRTASSSILPQNHTFDRELRKCKEARRWYGVRSSQSFTSNQATEQFVQWLMPEERKALFKALVKYETPEEKQSRDIEEDSQPTFYQLQLVIFSNAVPFVGFGFLDNAIMILAGEYIDKTIGITLGISTMAAAALGNLISDLLGIGLAGYVESLASKLGFDMPPLTPKQVVMWQTIYSSYAGRALGIIVGCLVGMFPLLLIDDQNSEDKDVVTSAAKN